MDVDDEGGARLAAEHLLALGHREFLVIGVEPPTPGRASDFGGVVGAGLPATGPPWPGPGSSSPTIEVVVGPASVEGGAPASRGPGRTAAVRPPFSR